jgi:hypothetical protein
MSSLNNANGCKRTANTALDIHAARGSARRYTSCASSICFPYTLNMTGPRYAPWLVVADELAALHEFVYSESGPFYRKRSAIPS